MSFPEDDATGQRGPSDSSAEALHPWVREEFDVASNEEDSLLEEFQVATVPETSETDELEARKAIRADICRLERDLANMVVTSFPMAERIHKSEQPLRFGRVLSSDELEFVRDDLAEQVRWAQAEQSVRAESQEEYRAQLEAMVQDPGEHRSRRISQKQLGEHGTGIYHVSPRLWVIGRLAGWYHVKLSG